MIPSTLLPMTANVTTSAKTRMAPSLPNLTAVDPTSIPSPPDSVSDEADPTSDVNPGAGASFVAMPDSARESLTIPPRDEAPVTVSSRSQSMGCLPAASAGAAGSSARAAPASTPATRTFGTMTPSSRGSHLAATLDARVARVAASGRASTAELSTCDAILTMARLLGAMPKYDK